MTSQGPKVSFTSIKPEDEFVQIVAGEHYKVDDSIQAVRVTVEWVSLPGVICDLDLNVYCYDDKGRFVEKLDFTHNVSNDNSAFLVADEGANDANTGLNITHTCLQVSEKLPLNVCFLQYRRSMSPFHSIELVS
jgi:hypothetical protein